MPSKKKTETLPWDTRDFITIYSFTNDHYLLLQYCFSDLLPESEENKTLTKLIYQALLNNQDIAESLGGDCEAKIEKLKQSKKQYMQEINKAIFDLKAKIKESIKE